METYLFDQKFHRLADFLGVDKYKRDNPEIAQKIAFLSDWGESRSKSENFADILRTIVKLKRDLGTTLRGETLVKDLYKWVRLDVDNQRIENEKKAYKEYSSEKEKREAELQERILNKQSQWEAKKSEIKQKQEETNLINEKIVKSKTISNKRESSIQSNANTKLVEVPFEDTSKNVAI